MARVSDYAARVARARAAGYASLSAQRTAQAHARGFSSRAAETQAAKQPTVQEVIDHWRSEGIHISVNAEARLTRKFSRQTYRQLNEKLNAQYYEIVEHAENGDDDWFYH